LPPALLTEFGNPGVGRAPPAWEFAKHVERGSLQIRYSRKGSVSRVRQHLELCARRVGEGRSGILEDEPPDLIGEKVNRTIEEVLSAVPERAGFFCRSSLRTESSCASEWVRRRANRSQ
jgi:hypothetical protein